ncbi:mannose-1-phosphate guanylyltransferase/mannose-6-phosphate isomerase [Methanococcus aeolicus]|uniref:mannose-1-phosphate guanylyltransferase/mannose-6-phosphate isomerase n=1 Tax=Methanococcus aeolicus TaxID=42879 RepID=UPI00064F4120|nr:mannose-1-phosphate guanylyltransferase/mannose-6-phosphate isomerase [Methanococcus aeolicus]
MKSLILAGGVGSRLFPLSREHYPKQFIKLKKFDKSLFQMTFERCLKLSNIDEIYIITNEKHKFLVLGQIEELGYEINNNGNNGGFNEDNILIEPIGRNTLPAIYYGLENSKNNKENNSNTIVGVFSSDHLIENEEEFISAVLSGQELAKEYMITFGIKPTEPNTGYGYIKPAEKLNGGYIVGEFKEKPDLKTAKQYIENNYLWNSGMFLFDANIFKNEVKKHCPDVYEAFKFNSVEEIYENVPDISVDYGIMEKSDKVAVIPLNIIWNDMGSFDSFYEYFEKDDQGNVIYGDNISIDSKNNLINTSDGKLVSLIGIEDTIVVDTKDVLLVCNKGESQKVKDIVKYLKNKKDDRIQFHTTVYRPWGTYTILEEGLFYKIKRITVHQGKKLSYQLHHHRSEHWVVVKGTASVTIEGNEMLVRSGESIFVKSGLKHRLENHGKIPLEVIEIQVGEYLEEDDIIRFDDDFGRK